MIYDYAPRLARLARARRRRHVLMTACLLMLPALSFQGAHRTAANAGIGNVQLAQGQR